MRQNSTIFYYLNNFKSDLTELYSIDPLLDDMNAEFVDVYDFLEDYRIEVDNRVVENVLDYSRNLFPD